MIAHTAQQEAAYWYRNSRKYLELGDLMAAVICQRWAAEDYRRARAISGIEPILLELPGC